MRRSWVSAALLLVGSSAIFLSEGVAQVKADQIPASGAVQSHPYVGMWLTEDGYIRHELRPNGRYVEARGTREKAYQGRYEITGDHIDYWDDTGFTADGDFVDGVLYHAGMVLYRDGVVDKKR
ncbi:Atu4866 domain-containing protein [Chelativorans sp. M5D2P16]|uniref:Atu4866 domain-containing protein n=1 Tax=Chelativorans sp. M5D2P16 TaxID=3095678 RepID=UPI002ACA243C|nr:Atu4866 domain-containing protein [Chelativorans sp. M5D2P16]MDZ5699492.1 Atu4866 domain-containing protein [Chelativorans sp. M5D2P16]